MDWGLIVVFAIVVLIGAAFEGGLMWFFERLVDAEKYSRHRKAIRTTTLCITACLVLAVSVIIYRESDLVLDGLRAMLP